MMKNRLLSLILILCLMLSCVAIGSFTVSAAPAEISADEAADYGIPDRCEDGNILHCFNWTLAQIKAELPNIAKAGFTAVQTSPLQPHDGNYQWYWLYQPTSFTIGNELGSYSDLKALCTEADQYNIKIIVDVVANHLAGSNNGSWGGIDNSLRKSEYFHNQGPCNNTDNRNELIYKNIGMPDLNSENIEIQNKVFSMLSNLKNAGVDGIRWDAAKHIGLPSEGCNFWAKMASMAGLYQYGEILDAPAGKSSDAVNDALITEYASYIGVTDEIFSSTITGSLRDKRLSKSKGNWIKRGVSAERVVYWGESHDTYGNDGWTNNLDQNVIDRAYAVLGARADSQTPLSLAPLRKEPYLDILRQQGQHPLYF